MNTARTLAYTGSKDVHCVVKNVSSTTHSYTVMPLTSASGKLHPKLFVTLKEKNGEFPKKGHPQADNLVVTCHSSHIMTKELMKTFFKEMVFDPSMPKDGILLVDSWSSWKDQSAIDSVTPASNKLMILMIPPGCTGHVQPCDVGIFEGFKKVMKILTNYTHPTHPDYNAHNRRNIESSLSRLASVLRTGARTSGGRGVKLVTLPVAAAATARGEESARERAPPLPTARDADISPPPVDFGVKLSFTRAHHWLEPWVAHTGCPQTSNSQHPTPPMRQRGAAFRASEMPLAREACIP